MNFDFITDNMAVGTTPETTADLQTLLDAGFSHVLNCRDDHDDSVLLARHFQYCWNGTPDWTPQAALGLEPKPVEWFQKSLEFWQEYLGPRQSRYRIYVHCTAGVNRSATTAWMFLRALRLKHDDCSWIIDHNRLVALVGEIIDRTWRNDAENALRTLGYIS